MSHNKLCMTSWPLTTRLNKKKGPSGNSLQNDALSRILSNLAQLIFIHTTLKQGNQKVVSPRLFLHCMPCLLSTTKKARWHKNQPSVANTSRMHTTISPSQLAATDSCFGLPRPHQHGIANILYQAGVLDTPLSGSSTQQNNVVSWVGNSTAVLPRQACGKVDHQKRPLCHKIFKYNKKSTWHSLTPTQLVFVWPCLHAARKKAQWHHLFIAFLSVLCMNINCAKSDKNLDSTSFKRGFP